MKFDRVELGEMKLGEIELDSVELRDEQRLGTVAFPQRTQRRSRGRTPIKLGLSYRSKRMAESKFEYLQVLQMTALAGLALYQYKKNEHLTERLDKLTQVVGKLANVTDRIVLDGTNREEEVLRIKDMLEQLASEKFEEDPEMEREIVEVARKSDKKMKQYPNSFVGNQESIPSTIRRRSKKPKPEIVEAAEVVEESRRRVRGDTQTLDDIFFM